MESVCVRILLFKYVHCFVNLVQEHFIVEIAIFVGLQEEPCLCFTMTQIASNLLDEVRYCGGVISDAKPILSVTPI